MSPNTTDFAEDWLDEKSQLE